MSEVFGARQKQSLVVLLLFIAGMFYMSNRENPESPEAQVRAAIEEMVRGAEKKDIDPFKKHLSEEVQDEQGRNKEVLLNTLRVIFLRHPRISLNLLDLDVAGGTNPDVIKASLTLLMSETALPTDKGNFFLTFRREGDTYRVWELRWDGGYGY